MIWQKRRGHFDMRNTAVWENKIDKYNGLYKNECLPE